MRLSLLLIVAVVLSLAHLERAVAQNASSVSIEISRTLNDATGPDVLHPVSSSERAALDKVYEGRQLRPLWSSADQPTPQAQQVLEILSRAADYGLAARDYGSGVLAAQLQDMLGTGSSDARRWAQFDVALSVAAYHFINHLHYGRVSASRAGFELGTTHQDIDIGNLLEPLATATDVPGFVGALEPRFHHYALLKLALAKYRRLATDPTLTMLPPFTRSIKPGDTYVGADRLRLLLSATGDLPTNNALSTGLVLDSALSTALVNFQRRHGLATDGAIGKQTFAALTTPLTARVRQIELTLERWRWVPEINSPSIIVNIPQYKVFAFAQADDREENFLQMDVIVGKSFPHTRTPVFTGDLRYVVFRPYWDVPYSIMKREMLAGIRKQPGYLDAKHLEIVRGQSDSATPVPPTPENVDALAAGNLRLRQRPGADNALGTVKFMFPNSHNVYLHSTPEHRLFGESRRTFSHGCIRVSDPIALAQYVLRMQKDPWPRERIEAAMAGEPAMRVNLDVPIRVLILYGTAVAAESGNIYFLDDVYGHDRKLEELLDAAKQGKL